MDFSFRLGFNIKKLKKMIDLNKFKHKTFLDGRIVMINADCEAVMAEIADKEIDLVLTDPPYGIGFDNKIREKKQRNWDSNIPNDNIFLELMRLGRNQIIWGGNYFPILWKNGCRGFIFWNKDVNINSYSAGELAYTNINMGAKYFYYAWNGLADGIRGRNKKEKTIHSTQKPIQLMAWCLNNYSKENDLIFDAFAGSFTTAIACIRTKRRFIGVELDPVYFEKAVERVGTELKQGTLF
jgi:site-specific DNA-methyltransferase (adenine-specific)